jgi:hypothetical protein
MAMRILVLLGLVAAAPLAAAEKRCGWIENPSPANWWLTDRQGEWTIMLQGGPEPAGMNKIPDLTTRDWVRTNGYYGYGCACMTVDTRFDGGERRIARIHSVVQLPLKQCRADRALKKPN